jgi:hypothetical protein
MFIVAIPLVLVIVGMVLNSIGLSFDQPPSSAEQDPTKRAAAESQTPALSLIEGFNRFVNQARGLRQQAEANGSKSQRFKSSTFKDRIGELS